MMEGEQEERDAKVRKSIVRLYGGQLTDDEVEAIIHLYNQVYGAVSSLVPVDDWTIRKMCEMLRPYLRVIWRDRWLSFVGHKRTA